MSTKVVGKLDDWNDADLGGSDFMNLEEGSNQVRIVGKAHQFYIHWTKDETGANRKVHCALDGCPLCQKGERAQPRWFVTVINRKTNKCAILEIGSQIYKSILNLFKKEKWGDPRQYDLDIERQPKGSQPLYVVSPNPKEALSDDEKGLVKEFNTRVDLVKMAVPATVEEICEKLGLSAPKAKPAVSNSFDEAEPVATEESGSDDDFNFDG